jgi:cyclopropane fatty-acyl-phospholipid synthase-like methyltransferase
MEQNTGDLTLAAYEAGIEAYLRDTAELLEPVRAFLDRIAALIPGGRVLELGSGPGRDADYLESRGLTVQRSDGAAAFVQRLRAAGHAEARVLDVRGAELGGPYDGIVANAVLLHLARGELSDLLARAQRAVRTDGVLAFTVKEGDGEGWSQAKLPLPRHFTYWREPELVRVVESGGWRVEACDHVPGRFEPWLQILARPAA